MINKLILTLLSIGVIAGVNAQNKLTEKGDKLAKKFRYDKALKFYKKASDANESDLIARAKLAKVFVETGDLQSAEVIYRTIATKPSAPAVYKFDFAQVLRSKGKYEEAAKFYEEFAKADPNNPLAEKFKNFAEEVVRLAQDRHEYTLISVPENSSASELSAAFLNNSIVITSNRKSASAGKNLDFMTGKNYYDIMALSTSAQYTAEPKKIKGKVDRKFNEGPCTFSSDGKEMIFTRSNYKKKSTGGIRMLGLYHAYWDEKKGWVNIEALPFNSTTYNVAEPSLSKDGSTLYFVSDMPGGEGETDIYVSTKQGNQWGPAINLGKEINTSGKEAFPFIAQDGTLYFSSDSRVGLGGLDIYSATYSGSKWTNITNMGTPINTAADDFGYISDGVGRDGYLVSNRPGGMGSEDIYKFHRLTETICGTVADAKSKQSISGVLIKAIADNGEVYTARSSEKGDYCMNLMPGKQYKVVADRDGFFTYEGGIGVTTAKNQKQTILMKPKGGIDLTVDVTKKGGGVISDATVFLINKNTGEIEKKNSDVEGKAVFDLFPDQQYDVKVMKKTGTRDSVYDRFTKTLSTMGFKPSQRINQDAQLTQYDGKFVFDLPNVYFEYNSYTIKPFAKKELDKVAEVMKTFPDMEVELSSHTDCRGSAAFNLGLSAMRAQACVLYLDSNGVNKRRLIAIGYGEERLVNKCKDGVPCTEQEHAVNRRTEFKVIKFD